MQKISSSLIYAIFGSATLLSLPLFVQPSTVAAENLKTHAGWFLQEKTDELQEAERLNLEAIKLYREGKHAEAIPLAERALVIQEKALGPDHKDVAVTINNLAFLYQHKKNYKKAESYFLRALAIKEKALGPDHLDVAFSLNNLGEFYYLRRKLDEAEPLYLRALALREKSLGPEHADVVQSLNNLGDLYYLKRDYKKASSFYIRTLPPKAPNSGEEGAITSVDSRPVPLNRPMPNYTERARSNGVQGIIRVRVLVGPDGRVKNVRIIRSLPDGLDEEAVRAAFQLRFKPAVKDGQAIAFWQLIDIEFRLQ